MPLNSSTAAYGIAVDRNAIIVARDGTKLACDVYRPDAPGSYPAILTMLPYRKDDVAAHAAHHDYFVPRGYAVVLLDMRGTGSSGGHTDMGDFCGPEDQLDGYDAIEWIAEQPWCDGAVGMTGVSFGWFTSLLTATRRPPHLRAIAPIYGGVDFYDDWNEGGSMLGHLFSGRYSAQMLAYNSAPPSLRDEDGRWLDVWNEHLDNNEPWLFSWLGNQTETDFWKECSIRYHYGDIDVPIFAIGGWADFNPSDALRVFQNVAGPVRVLVGPWTHMEPTDAIPGPRIDHLHELLRWWDCHLKGVDNGIKDEPPITIFVQEGRLEPAEPDRRGRWRFEDQWPVAGVTHTKYFGPDGRLSRRRPRTSDGADEFRYVPTVGTTAGLVGGVASGVGLPGDQRPDAAFSLVYTSAPLDNDTEITGVPTADLHISSTAGVAAFVVKLCEVEPDGFSSLITRGSANATRRESRADPEPLEQEQVYRLSVELRATSYVIPRGHRIQVIVAGADFPWLWSTPEPAVNTVHRSQTHPSSITLPVVPTRRTTIAAPLLKPSPNTASPIPDANLYEISRDILNGSTTVSWGSEKTEALAGRDKYAHRRYIFIRANDLEPSDVTVEGTATFVTVVGGSETRVRSRSTVRSDADAFHADLSVEIEVDGGHHWRRAWSRSFARELL